MSNHTIAQILIYSQGRCIGVFRTSHMPSLNENAPSLRFLRSDTNEYVSVTKAHAVIAVENVKVSDPIPGERLGWWV